MIRRHPSIPLTTPFDDPAVVSGVYDALPEAVALTDREHRIRLVNRAFEQRFDCTSADALGTDVRNLFERFPSDLVHDQAFDSSCRVSGSSSFEAETTVSDLATDGETIGYVYHIRDLSRQHRMISSLAAARDEAEAASRMKSAFLASISHEIRTPMNGVLGMTELILDTSLSRAQREYAESIFYSSESLLKLIDDLLDLSKIDAGKLDLESTTFDLYRVAGDVVDLFAPQANAKGVRIAYAVDPALPAEAVGDPLRLRQVLTNLVSNAVKFTKQGEIIVRLEPIAHDGDAVGVRGAVSDTGIGIRTDDMHRLFTAFSQMEGDTARRFGGTGLGLAISRQLVELMDGTILVTSEPGVGSTFTFEVPHGSAATFEVPHGSAAAPRVLDRCEGSLHGLRALVVDDSREIRKIITSYLKAWEVDVSEASDDAEAIRMTEEQDFGVALVQSNLNDASGVELAEKLRRARTSMKLILVTSYRERALTDDLRTAGVDACLAQPIWPHRLRSALASVLTEPTSEPGEPVAEPPGSSGGRILLVEDNVVNQRVASAMLQRLGYVVEIASSGGAAIDAVGRDRFDVVLMDCQMPVMDGFETTQRIRELTGDRSRVPIIALTANAMRGDRDRCLKAGMNDYLTKPLRTEALKDTVGRWIRDVAAA